MIQRADRPFLSIWRGSREFTELRRGSRVLWQKEVPEEPKVPLERVRLTAASYADLALLDFVQWAIGQGYAGHVSANIAGEAHTLAGIGSFLTVRSEVTANDGRTAELAIGEGSELHVESLQDGAAVSAELVLEAGEVWLPKVLTDGTHTADPLPCLLPDGRWAWLLGGAYRKESVILNVKDVKRTIKLMLNDVIIGSVSCVIPRMSQGYVEAWSYRVPESVLNEVLADTEQRPLALVADNTPTSYFEKDGTGIKLKWNEIKTVVNLIVTDHADENML